MNVASLCLTALLLSPLLANAQTILTPELHDSVNNGINNAINGVTIFTSQSSISSGSFTIDGAEGEGDSDVIVNRLPFSFDLTEESKFTPFISGNVGYFEVIEHIAPVEGPGSNDFSKIESWSGSLGIGVKIKALDSFTITPDFSVSYAHTRNYYDYNNQFSQEIIQPYGKQVFGWYVDTMTYIPSLRIQYQCPVGASTLKLWTKYSHLFNDSIATDSPTMNVNSNTGLWQNSAGFKFPIEAKIRDNPLAVRTTLTRSDVYRSGREGLEFGYFYDLSVDVIAELKDVLQPLKELSLGGSYSFSENFRGWRVGIGYDF